LATSDFVTVVRQEIDHVAVSADATAITLHCRDLKRSAKGKVFFTGDDGQTISDQHPRTLSANPMDVCLLIFQNELGLGQPQGLPESAWTRYDPAQWSGGANPTLINPNPYLDLAQFLFYRDGIFAGYKLDFSFTQPVEAKQFLDFEIFKALGGYLIVLADGRLSPRFFFPPYTLSALRTLSERNLVGLPRVERQSIINQVSVRLDYEGGKFGAELLFAHAPSIQQFNLLGQQIVESKGLRRSRGAVSLLGITAQRLFHRYAGIDPLSGEPNGGAVMLNVTAHLGTLAIDVGDYVSVSHSLLPDFLRGRRGIVNRIFEVIERQPNFREGTMQYKLLDTGWLGGKKLSKIAPNGTPAWTAASQTQKDKYMFIAAAATGAYSDGTAGKTIW
jgi:hypothetical protein